MTTADVLHDLSLWVRNRTSLARTHGWDLREETVTENLLLDLCDRLGGGTRIYKTDIVEESQFGPDWLWAIEMNGAWLTLWVQAKKASGWGVVSYAGLQGKESRLQGLRLAANAFQHDAIPTYAFFNPDSPPLAELEKVAFGACGRASLMIRPNGLPWRGVPVSGFTPAGVTMADAFYVVTQALFGRAGDRRRVSSVLQYSMPWECLVCPGRPAVPATTPVPNPDLPLVVVPRLAEALAYLTRRRRPESQGNVGQAPFGVSAGPPNWVGPVLEGQSPIEFWSDEDGQDLPAYFVVTPESG